MLILGRRLNERIFINDELIITISEFLKNPQRVKLGFEGSLEKYVIDREEIYIRKMDEKLRRGF